MVRQRFVLMPGEEDDRGRGLATLRLMARSTAGRRGARSRAAGEREGQPLPHALDAVETDAGVEGLLVEMDPTERRRLRSRHPDLRLVRERTAVMALARPHLLPLPLPKASAARRATATLTLRARSAAGRPIAGAFLALAYAEPRGFGAEAVTDRRGEARLVVRRSARAEYVRVEPPHGFWHAALVGASWSGDETLEIVCPPIEPAAGDVLAAFGGVGSNDDGAGVVVAVVDGGAGPHPALPVLAGANLTEPGRVDGRIEDNGIGHGTHVAGIIASRSDRGGIQGMAPGVTLRIYRVYARNSTSAGSFSIGKAIRQAADDGADLINLSLTLGELDGFLMRQLEHARAKGCVVLAAAGNEARGVAAPARSDSVLAVSAAGWRGSWPNGAAHGLDVRRRPRGERDAPFMAVFSNHGPQIDLVGAGVAVVSLYPKGRLAVMNGTSMATPAATGALARELARDSALMSRARDRRRSEEIAALALRSARSLGFPAGYQGRGVLGRLG